MYLQLADSDKKSVEVAFNSVPYVEYEHFVSRRQRRDIYLTDLLCLATMFGGMADKALVCAFVAGLLEEVRQLLRAVAGMEAFDLDQILTRARVVIKDGSAMASSETILGAITSPNHDARDCLERQQGDMKSSEAGVGGSRRPRHNVRCYSCGALCHFASACSVNEPGGEASAIASSHAHQ